MRLIEPPRGPGPHHERAAAGRQSGPGGRQWSKFRRSSLRTCTTILAVDTPIPRRHQFERLPKEIILLAGSLLQPQLKAGVHPLLELLGIKPGSSESLSDKVDEPLDG